MTRPVDHYAKLALERGGTVSAPVRFAAGNPQRMPKLGSPAYRVRAFEVTLPLVTVNGTNERRHWTARCKRAKLARKEWAAAVVQFCIPALPLPLAVTLTRRGPRVMDDDGNQAALKHCRDAVSEWAGLDDADERIAFRYRQERCASYAVVVRVESQCDNPEGT